MRLLLVAGWCSLLLAQEQKKFAPKPPPEQPLPFSHKVHAATGIKCTDCHTIRPPGDHAGLPAEAVCMGCHATVRKDSPAIERLAAFAKAGQRVPWVRVLRRASWAANGWSRGGSGSAARARR